MLKNLKKLRNELGISQQQLAETVTVSQQSINKYENHSVEPDISTMTKIADFFNVSLDYLVGRSEIKECAPKLKASDLNADEAEFIKTLRRLNDNQRRCIKALTESIVND